MLPASEPPPGSEPPWTRLSQLRLGPRRACPSACGWPGWTEAVFTRPTKGSRPARHKGLCLSGWPAGACPPGRGPEQGGRSQEGVVWQSRVDVTPAPTLQAGAGRGLRGDSAGTSGGDVVWRGQVGPGQGGRMLESPGQEPGPQRPPASSSSGSLALAWPSLHTCYPRAASVHGLGGRGDGVTQLWPQCGARQRYGWSGLPRRPWVKVGASSVGIQCPSLPSTPLQGQPYQGLGPREICPSLCHSQVTN